VVGHLTDKGPEHFDFNSIIGNVLRYGVIVSFVIILIGSVLLFYEGSTGYYTLGSAQDLFQRHNKFLIGLVPTIQGIALAKPYAIIELGLIVLLATPIARVAISIFLFASERRYILAAITCAVLTILLTSMFLIGPMLA